VTEFNCNRGEIHGSNPNDRCIGGCHIIGMDGKSAKQLAYEAAHENNAKCDDCKECTETEPPIITNMHIVGGQGSDNETCNQQESEDNQ